MSDIEELAQLLGQPGEDLDWGGEHFCFLEYEHDQTVVANQQLHHPQQDINPPPHIMASEDCSSGNKRRMSEAFQCQAYPSHASGPVLVPAPAPACLPIILNSSSSNSSNSSSNSSVSSNSTTTGGRSSRSGRHAQLLSVKAKDEEDSLSFSMVAATSKVSTPTSSSSSCFSEEAELEQERQEQGNGRAAAVGARTEAVAQRMERKKTREKMRRQEVNDKLNELMEVLMEADSKGQTPAEKKQQQAQAASIDKGNFRVDVLSRAVRVIKRLNEEVKCGQAEVEHLRAQLEQTFLQSKREVEPQEQQQPQQQETVAADSSFSSAESHSRYCNTSTTISSSNNSNNSSNSSKLNPSMTWVTVPMWVPSGSNVAHADHAAAMVQAKGIMLDSNNGGNRLANGANPFPYPSMPFFVPQHAQGHMQNGGVVGIPSMMMPASGGGSVSTGYGGNEDGGVVVGQINGGGVTNSFPWSELWEEEAPTHAPCA